MYPWFKFYRNIYKIFPKDPNVWALFGYLVSIANEEDEQRKDGVTVPRGALDRTIAQLADEGNLTTKQCRTVVDKLAKEGFIERQSVGKRFTIITICNFDNYVPQKNEEGKPRANRGQSNGNPRTNQGQSEGEPTATFIIDNRIKNKDNKGTTNKQQRERFENWLKCKEYLTANGKVATDAGYERFYIINQEGTDDTPPYWYKDGVLDSFDNFMARPANRKRYTPKGEGKGKGNAPQVAAGSPKTLSVADFNIKIAHIMKQPMSQTQREDLLSLKYQGDRNEKGELIIYTNIDSWNRLVQSDLKGVLTAEFWGYRLAPTII